MNGEDRVRVYSTADIPRYHERGYEVSQEFSRRHAKDPAGLFLLFPEDGALPITSKLNGELRAKYEREDGLLFKPRVYDLLEEHAHRDGAIVFDRKGKVKGTEVFVNGVSLSDLDPEVQEETYRIKGRKGTSSRFMSALYASTKGWSSVAESEETGVVIAFMNGKIVRSYVPADEAEIKSVKEVA